MRSAVYLVSILAAPRWLAMRRLAQRHPRSEAPRLGAAVDDGHEDHVVEKPRYPVVDVHNHLAVQGTADGAGP